MEQTFQNYSKRSRGNGSYGANERQVEIKDGVKYPKHPAAPHHVADFPVIHRGCYYCGGQHEFRSYPRNNEPRALTRMRVNIQWHQPKLYFNLDQTRMHPSCGANMVYVTNDSNDGSNQRMWVIPAGKDHGAGINTPAWFERQQ